MKTTLLVIIIVAVGFSSFLLGYSLPSFIEAGVIGGGPNKVKAGAQIDKQTSDYYKNLLKEE